VYNKNKKNIPETLSFIGQKKSRLHYKKQYYGGINL
jgi:hypothetical protein